MQNHTGMKFVAAVFCFVAIWGISPAAVGDALPRYYYQDEGVVEFQDRPSIETFDKVSPEFQAMILAELMSEPNLNDELAHLRGVLFSRHFYSLPPDTQGDVLGRAFAMAVESGSIDRANQIFQTYVPSAPYLASKFICRTLTAVQDRGYEYDPEIMKNVADRMASMVPLVRSHPEIADHTCDIVFRDDVMDRISIRRMLTDASPEFGKALQPPAQRAGAVPVAVKTQPGTHAFTCDKQSLKFHFTNTERVLKRLSIGARSFMEINVPGCLISGIATKTGKEKYEFVNNLKWKENEKAKFEFVNAVDAAEKYLSEK